MRRALLIAVVLGVLTGCQMPPDEAKIQANDRWQTARSRLLYGVAQEHLKSGQLDLACTKAQEALRLKEDFLEAHLL